MSGIRDALIFIEGISILRGKEFPSAAPVSDGMHEDIKTMRQAMKNAIEQISYLTERLEVNGKPFKKYYTSEASIIELEHVLTLLKE